MQATELFFYTPAGDLATVTKLITKSGSMLFCLPYSLNGVFALTKEEAENMVREGVGLDTKWWMCREMKEEVEDPVARKSDLARHMSCLQEQLDQMKMLQLQLSELTLNCLKRLSTLTSGVEKPSSVVEPRSKSCSENSIESGNRDMADPRLMGESEKDVSISLPGAQGMAKNSNKSTKDSCCVSVADKNSTLIQEQRENADSLETGFALQEVVTIRPRIIKRRQSVVAVNSSVNQQK